MSRHLFRAQPHVAISTYRAETLLRAREVLARDAANPYAIKVLENFATFLTTGVEPVSFAEFMLPITDEELRALEIK
jgi:hypothetical protein